MTAMEKAQQCWEDWRQAKLVLTQEKERLDQQAKAVASAQDLHDKCKVAYEQSLLLATQSIENPELVPAPMVETPVAPPAPAQAPEAAPQPAQDTQAQAVDPTPVASSETSPSQPA